MVENIEMKQFICDLCNKNYKDKSGLWYHNKKFHDIKSHAEVSLKSVESKSVKNNLYSCKYCDNEYKHKQSKYKHEKTCMNKNQNNNLVTKIEKLEKQIDKLKNKPTKKIINNINNIGSINTFNKICNIGEENINLLSNDEKQFIMSQGMNSIVSLIDYLNFNDKLPQHHNFYTSAINDKHVNTIDYKNNCIIKKTKKDLFDQILSSHMTKLESITKNSVHFSKIFDKLKSFIYLKQGKKEFISQLNLLSYNKKNIIIQSWDKLISDDSLTPEDIPDRFEAAVKKLTQTDDYKSQSDSDTNSYTESDSESEERFSLPLQKKVNKKNIIL